MDRRSWPWKKKSSEKAAAAADSAAAVSNSAGNQSDQDAAKTINYVQIPVETYKHLNELEDQVKVLQEKVSSAQTEMTNKENLVKQHAKVAEEAVSGWEKAEAEASALKNQLESVTLLKLTAEERALHLDGALKECMKQVRNVKEESEQKLHDVVFAKTKQWEKIKGELEAKLADFEQELLRASAENSAISRSLQERSNTLMQVSDEKTQAEAEIELLKSNIQSFEREISSLKYELHVVAKELEIRNEEKNMSVRSADVANKQHLEDVKKISKLEAECQRLRGLVRKKLPGPAALAQMKLEVESLGRDYGDNRLRRSPAKNSSPNHFAAPSAADYAFENLQQVQKENEFLTARLLTMEEETKMLKEALTNRNSELQASRNLCAKTTSKLRTVEAQIMAINHQKSPPKSGLVVPFGTTLIQNGSNPPSSTSMSEDGIDDEGSCSESWATALMSELSQFKKQKPTDQYSKTDNSSNLELMDDFLEMERLACLPRESNGSMDISDGLTENVKSENADALLADQNDGVSKEQGLVSEISGNSPYSTEKHSEGKSVSEKNNSQFINLKLRIASIFESQESDHDVGKLLEDIRHIMQDTQEEVPQHSVGCIIEETHSTNKKQGQEHMEGVRDDDSSLKKDHDANHISDQELQNAISKIHDFVMSFGKKAAEMQDELSNSPYLYEKIQKFSSVVKEVLSNKRYVNTFIFMLSQILSEVSEMGHSISNDKGIEGESNISDCIDKVTLLENKVAQREPRQGSFLGAASTFSRSSSHPEIDGPISDNFEVKPTMQSFSLEEFEQIKMEKETIEMEFANCSELLEKTKVQLAETEQNLAGLRSQLMASQKSNSLAETQLKCMAESYKLLEQRAQELEAEVNLLRMNLQTLNEELQEEKRIHQDDLEKYKDLQEQIERTQKCSDADIDMKTKQEKEIAAAAEKLVECQETILLLGRQLQSLRPQAEAPDFSPNHRFLANNEFPDEIPGPSGLIHGPHAPRHSTEAEIDVTDGFLTSRTGEESPVDGYNSQISPSDAETAFPSSPVGSKRVKHRSSRSSSSGSIPNAVPEKHGRGFSRFFSKARNDH